MGLQQDGSVRSRASTGVIVIMDLKDEVKQQTTILFPMHRDAAVHFVLDGTA